MNALCCKDGPCALTTLWSPSISYEQFIWSLLCEKLCAERRETLWGLMRYVWNTGEHVVPARVMAYSVIAHLHVFIMTEALSTQRLRALENIWEGKSCAWKGSRDSVWVQMGKSEKQSKSTSYCMHRKSQICLFSDLWFCDLSSRWGYFTLNLPLRVIQNFVILNILCLSSQRQMT